MGLFFADTFEKATSFNALTALTCIITRTICR